ncbi:uncharacterized protein BDZ99DRAFT_465224 [Mytilinidion resinicola]|uniref:Secreted protein n=1 Tax=Mytilinidion resinicola TaxID=574789 RepID=A0A6A6YFK3_9PEZI|nr:uncharacterized protein BDZ99DRAFT_465224 [Mytilinidion resinicola]KAF2807313.1 hypothetical protein BDZ99DRAFT_465224 [Mytilinidion resinicola]
MNDQPPIGGYYAPQTSSAPPNSALESDYPAPLSVKPKSYPPHSEAPPAPLSMEGPPSSEPFNQAPAFGQPAQNNDGASTVAQSQHYEAYHPPNDDLSPPFSEQPGPELHQPIMNPAYPPEKPQGAADTAMVPSNAPQPLGVQQYQPPLPPRRIPSSFGADDPSNPVHYTRDPHKLVAYLVPFPKPRVHVPGATLSQVPERFLIYTPPPPPLQKPAEGVKEDRMHKVQRKWEEEVRAAKNSTAKTASWQGAKSKATKGISWAMSQTKSANLEFLTRLGEDRKSGPARTDTNAAEGGVEGDATHKTVALEEMVLIYPSTMPGTQEELRAEFVNSMMRSKSKAQRDAVIATGLIPVSFAIDVLATIVWPFGGLLEIDSVWAYSSIRGAKTARSTTKRLKSSNEDSGGNEQQLRLTFTPSPRLEILGQYLAARCHERDAKLFGSPGVPPTETTVLEAIGWSQSGHFKNWEDEQWEIAEVKEDIKSVMSKGAREWDKWCKDFEKNPEKAAKK